VSWIIWTISHHRICDITPWSQRCMVWCRYWSSWWKRILLTPFMGKLPLELLFCRLKFFSLILQFSLLFVVFNYRFLALNLSMWTFLLPLASLDCFTSQDCAVGLLFALLPVLGGTSGVLQGLMSMTKV
jgi:hypothetical protein